MKLPHPSLPATLAALFLVSMAGCTREGQPLSPTDQELQVRFLHTSDWHSRLLPYDFQPPRSDEELGLAPENAPFGGVARMATLLKRQRSQASRVLHLDSGDCFQGAPIFNFYKGEVEIRSMTAVGVNAAVIGNHEFDSGVRNLHTQLSRWARYPILAANYVFENPDNERGIEMARVAQPWVILDAGGVRVGVIGAANLSSLSSIGEAGNSMGVQPIDELQVFQGAIDLLEPQVDLIVLLSHMGLKADERIIRQSHGLDLVFGGHHHIVLNPPKVIEDASGRPVPLVHSGAFMKYLGRLDVVIKDGEVLSHDYTVFPIDSGSWRAHCQNPTRDPQSWCPTEIDEDVLDQPWLPESRKLTELLEPYILDMGTRIDLKRVLAYSPQRIRRFGATSGDSALGNLVADGMLFRERVEADFALTNSLGIRTDFNRGPISLEQMFNVFPFENSIVKMLLSGDEIAEMLDFVAQRSASRGCQSQAQVSGMRFRMNCVDQFRQSWADLVFVGPPQCLAALVHDEEGEDLRFPELGQDDVALCGGAVQRVVGVRACLNDRGSISPLSFDAAVNDYIARGGSGFDVLKVNTSKIPTGIALRDSVTDWLRKLPPCSASCPPEEVSANRCQPIKDCTADLSDYYARECSGLVDAHRPEACASGGFPDAECSRSLCQLRSTDRARSRCMGSLTCVSAKADGRISQRFLSVTEVESQGVEIPECRLGEDTDGESLSQPLRSLDGDEACDG